MPEIDLYIAHRALTGIDDECGDVGVSIRSENTCLAALVDGLGHGAEARKAALLAVDCIRSLHRLDLVDIIAAVHDRLRGSRGAVAALCRLDLATGHLSCCGMGNISLRILGNRPERLVTREGILGYMIPSPRLKETRLFSGDMLLMASDGIRAHFDPDSHPAVFSGNARTMARNIIQTLGKQNDDASCIVLRYGP